MTTPVNGQENNNGGELPSSAPPSIDMLAKLFNPGGGPMPNDEVEENEGVVQNEPENTPEPVPASPPQNGVDASELARATAALTQAASALQSRATTPAQEQQQQDQPRIWVTPEQIPAAMAQLMNSEDPAERIRGQALFANALAGMIYRQFQEDVTKQYQPQFESLVQERLNQVQQINTFREEFSKSYPALVGSEAGNLVARHIVTEVGREFAAQGKQANWFDPNFRKAFDAKLKALGIDPKQGVAKPQPAPAPKNQPTPVSRSNGARPVDPAPGTSTQADSMAAVLRTAGIRVG